ncbi:MAG: hypothetical protein ACJAZN_003052, partial [Planctomycetota bacterium]
MTLFLPIIVAAALLVPHQGAPSPGNNPAVNPAVNPGPTQVGGGLDAGAQASATQEVVFVAPAERASA